jgi:uncharacterized membrane protein YagU involved in acid resistance
MTHNIYIYLNKKVISNFNLNHNLFSILFFFLKKIISKFFCQSIDQLK